MYRIRESDLQAIRSGLAGDLSMTPRGDQLADPAGIAARVRRRRTSGRIGFRSVGNRADGPATPATSAGPATPATSAVIGLGMGIRILEVEVAACGLEHDVE